MSWRGLLLRCVAFVLVAVGAHSVAHAQVFGTGPWSGLYVGVHGGYSWENASDAALDGTALGLQAGYNLQLGSALVGIEADYSWSQAKGRAIIPGSIVNGSIDSMWSVRGRLGWVLANSVLVYGTAGYGGFDVALNGTVGTLAFSGSADFNGLVAGGGLEVLLTRNIMVRGEVLHYMGSGNQAAAGIGNDITVIRAGLSYKF